MFLWQSDKAFYVYYLLLMLCITVIINTLTYYRWYIIAHKVYEDKVLNLNLSLTAFTDCIIELFNMYISINVVFVF